LEPKRWRIVEGERPHSAPTVASVRRDPDVMSTSGRAFGSWHLGREDGVVDVDGSRPDWGEHFEREVLPALVSARP
jgi:hypothetical protein